MLAVGKSGDKIPSNRSARADTLGECVSGAQEAALRPQGRSGERGRGMGDNRQDQVVQRCPSVSVGTLASALCKPGATEGHGEF